MTTASPSSAPSPRASEAAARLPRLTVRPNAVVSNWRFFAGLSGAECAPVVKADCYGLGVEAVAPALAAAGARSFFVATGGEGFILRRVLGDGPAIYVFNGASAAEAAALRAAGLVPVLSSPAQIASWPKEAPFALHLDTGMNRLGVKPHEISAAAGLAPVLVMSHLACGGDRRHPKNEAQRTLFVQLAAGFPGARKSLSASAGALLGRDYGFDVTRPGIGLYGGGPMDSDNPSLSAAATLEAPILQVFDLPAGETVGYGATFTASTPLRAATCAIGYADGWLRSLSGRGYGVIGGATCPLLGRVSMDLVTLDISAAPDARAGDMVEFLGPNARVDDVAARAGTISYEILTNLTRVARMYA